MESFHDCITASGSTAAMAEKSLKECSRPHAGRHFSWRSADFESGIYEPAVVVALFSARLP